MLVSYSRLRGLLLFDFRAVVLREHHGLGVVPFHHHRSITGRSQSNTHASLRPPPSSQQSLNNRGQSFGSRACANSVMCHANAFPLHASFLMCARPEMDQRSMMARFTFCQSIRPRSDERRARAYVMATLFCL